MSYITQPYIIYHWSYKCAGIEGKVDGTDSREVLDPLSENVGIEGKVDGSGSIPITGS